MMRETFGSSSPTSALRRRKRTCSTFIIGKDLQEGRLRAALSEYIPVERHVYAIYLPTRHLPAKVRAFIDFLLERFGSDPVYWDRE